MGVPGGEPGDAAKAEKWGSTLQAHLVVAAPLTGLPGGEPADGKLAVLGVYPRVLVSLALSLQIMMLTGLLLCSGPGNLPTSSSEQCQKQPACRKCFLRNVAKGGSLEEGGELGTLCKQAAESKPGTESGRWGRMG